MRKKLKILFKNIITSNSSNFEIAYGFGIGIFVGFLPIYGFQTIISILLAIIFKKANRISLIFATQLFLPPIIPIVIAMDYFIGALILYRKIEIIKIEQLKDILIYVKPIFLGSVIVAPIMGIISGTIFYYILKKIKKNKNSIDKPSKMQ